MHAGVSWYASLVTRLDLDRALRCYWRNQIQIRGSVLDHLVPCSWPRPRPRPRCTHGSWHPAKLKMITWASNALGLAYRSLCSPLVIGLLALLACWHGLEPSKRDRSARSAAAVPDGLMPWPTNRYLRSTSLARFLECHVPAHHFSLRIGTSHKISLFRKINPRPQSRSSHSRSILSHYSPDGKSTDADSSNLQLSLLTQSRMHKWVSNANVLACQTTRKIGEVLNGGGWWW
jgi:hypothetical protein